MTLDLVVGRTATIRMREHPDLCTPEYAASAEGVPLEVGPDGQVVGRVRRVEAMLDADGDPVYVVHYEHRDPEDGENVALYLNYRAGRIERARLLPPLRVRA